MKLLTIPQAAKILQVGETELYRMAKRGDVPCVAIGRRRRIPELELHAWLQHRLPARYRIPAQDPPTPARRGSRKDAA